MLLRCGLDDGPVHIPPPGPVERPPPGPVERPPPGPVERPPLGPVDSPPPGPVESPPPGPVDNPSPSPVESPPPGPVDALPPGPVDIPPPGPVDSPPPGPVFWSLGQVLRVIAFLRFLNMRSCQTSEYADQCIRIIKIHDDVNLLSHSTTCQTRAGDAISIHIQDQLVDASMQSRHHNTSRYWQSSVRCSLRSDSDFHWAAGGGRGQDVMHGLRDVIGLDHLAAVELPVGRDQWGVDEAG